MKGLRTTLVSIIAVGLLAGSVVGAAGQDGQLPVTVTGDMEYIESYLDIESFVDEVDGQVVERDHWASTGRLEVSDARLTGDFRGEGTMNRYQPVDGEGAAEVWSGTLRVENDGGVWEGTEMGCSGCGNAGGGSDTSYFELVGSGGYEGLSAILFVEERPSSGPDWVNGVIIPGDVPSE